ncbi:MAG TPA: HAD family hydrolase [Chloroflexota bacterium]|nr:HAD family hydrolase [Chloroflexota bacterium]
MSVRAVLFDLDDTLVAQDSADDQALVAACALLPSDHADAAAALPAAVRRHARALWEAGPAAAYCRAIGISALEGMWARFDTPLPQIAALASWAPTYRLAAWRQALDACGLADVILPGQLLAAFQQTRRRLHLLFPETLATLDALRPLYQLGLVTNGAPDLQRAKIGGSGLGEWFEVMLVSGEFGIGKPDPRIFAAALERLRLGPNQVVMVGNSLDHDIMGAHAAGIGSVWVNRAGEIALAGSAPDATITSLSELPTLLADWPS